MKNKTRKELNRTGQYPCEICNKEEFLEDHHIEGRKIKDWNKPFNRVNICPTCHRNVHEGVVEIEGWFSTTSGRELFWHKIGEDNEVSDGKDT